jgi:acyl dehydratase
VSFETIPVKERGPVVAEELRAYAAASGDPNPIHLDDKVARAMGLPGVIAHGMLVAAWVVDRGAEFMREEGESWRLRSFQTRFRAMTRLGDTISIGGSVKEESEQGRTLDLVARNQRGETVITATARFSR